MELFRSAYRKVADKIASLIAELIGSGKTPQQAVQEALGRYPPGEGVQEELADLLLEAAINGTGMDRKAFTRSMIDAMRSTLVNLPWSADNMPLSQRLHKLNGVARQALDDEIHTAMRKGTTWQTLSRQLYDGYGHGGKLRRAEDIPGYLKQLQQAARRVIGDDPEAMQAYNALLRQVSRLKTPGLRAGYAKLLEAAKHGTVAAEAKAIHTALEERSRYYAERIARTELARAWADGFYVRTLGDADVVAYQWRLSSNHPVHDVCDFHAKADLYGLGPGIYPKNRMPPMPAHPHCRCHLVEVFAGELDGKAQDGKLHERGQAYLESLTPAEQTRLLGVEGREKWQDGAPWEQQLVGWTGHEEPSSRLKNLFQFGGADGIMGIEDVVALEQAKKRDHKIAVTDVAIDKVPLVQVKGFTQAQNLALQEAHKEILRIAKTQNDSNEVLGIYNIAFNRWVHELGDEFGVNPSRNPEAFSILKASQDKEVLYLHNHPSTNKFSFMDIFTFINDDRIKIMSVITNQGEVYLLNKNEDYSYTKAMNALRPTIQAYRSGSMAHDETVDMILKICKKGGIDYEKAK